MIYVQLTWFSIHCVYVFPVFLPNSKAYNHRSAKCQEIRKKVGLISRNLLSTIIRLLLFSVSDGSSIRPFPILAGFVVELIVGDFFSYSVWVCVGCECESSLDIEYVCIKLWPLIMVLLNHGYQSGIWVSPKYVIMSTPNWPRRMQNRHRMQSSWVDNARAQFIEDVKTSRVKKKATIPNSTEFNTNAW